jgi:acetyl esterase/lipase
MDNLWKAHISGNLVIWEKRFLSFALGVHMDTTFRVDRRSVLLATLGGIVPTSLANAQAEITHPVISETDCPLEIIKPVASDGYSGLAVLRKPPGNGPFPLIISIHGGITTMPLSKLEEDARESANATRFLAAGYVVIVPTYRSRDVDLQSIVSLEDCLAVVEYARKLSYVDADSIVVFGCSGGGDLALEVAARTKIAAVVPEEPAAVIMAGIYNNTIPRKGERYTPADGFYLLESPRQYYTPEFQKIFRAKIAKIQCPILVIQGDVDRRVIPVNKWNYDILFPELRAAGKTLDVKVYPGQMHCFCIDSGIPRPAGRGLDPLSWSSAAADASRDIDAFCRRYLKTQPKEITPRLVTYANVRR